MNNVSTQQRPFSLVNDFEQAFTMPEFAFEPGRWSTTRGENVEAVSDHWESHPNTIRFLEDPKLVERGTSLAVLRKELLEQILTPLMKLQDGRAAIKFDIKLVQKGILGLKKNISFALKQVRANADKDPDLRDVADLMDGFLDSVEAIELSVTHLATASILMQKASKSTSPPLTDEEKKLAHEALKSESDEPAEQELNDFLSTLK